MNWREVCLIAVIVAMIAGLFCLNSNKETSEQGGTKTSDPVATVMSPTPTMPKLGVAKNSHGRSVVTVSGTLTMNQKFE